MLRRVLARGSAVLNVETSRTGLSSFFKRTELTATGNRIERREVRVRTLDEMVQDRQLKGPFGVKIDTEGFELEVVRGATAVLKACQFVITETSTSKRFEGGYESVDLIDELRRHEFVVPMAQLHLRDALREPRTGTLSTGGSVRSRDQTAEAVLEATALQ